MANPLQSILSKIWHKYAEDVGISLIHLGALGWFLSSAAQLAMIITNKDIDKKEKQFLIPQEASDGAINVILYYTICQAIKKYTESLLERGKILTEKAFECIEKLKTTPNSASDFIKALSEFYRHHRILKKEQRIGNLSDFYRGSIILLSKPAMDRNRIIKNNPMLKSVFGRAIEENKVKTTKGMLNRALKDYNLYKNGVGVIAAVGASILACNIITPVARNLTANMFQKSAMNKQKTAELEKNPLSYYSRTLPPTFNTFKI